MRSHFETITAERHGDHILLVTLNRPDAANALNTQMGLDLMDVFERYFHYVVYCVCGIPAVTLEGTPTKLDDFEDLLRGYGIVELQRTGRIALPKLDREQARLRTAKGKAS